ncbi:MAG: hypothetical protein CMP20_15445 [Rickettsiales bacterium]|nr:hypothetical protein [Rickettsiales bacterium]
MSSYSETDEFYNTTDCESLSEDKRTTLSQLERFANAMSVLLVAMYIVLVYTVAMAECPLDDKRFDGFHLFCVVIYAVFSLGATFFSIAFTGYQDRQSRACAFLAHITDCAAQISFFFVAVWFIVEHRDQIVPFIGIFALCMTMNIIQAVIRFILYTRYPVMLQDFLRILRA